MKIKLQSSWLGKVTPTRTIYIATHNFSVNVYWARFSVYGLEFIIHLSGHQRHLYYFKCICLTFVNLGNLVYNINQ